MAKHIPLLSDKVTDVTVQVDQSHDIMALRVRQFGACNIVGWKS